MNINLFSVAKIKKKKCQWKTDAFENTCQMACY